MGGYLRCHHHSGDEPSERKENRDRERIDWDGHGRRVAGVGYRARNPTGAPVRERHDELGLGARREGADDGKRLTVENVGRIDDLDEVTNLDGLSGILSFWGCHKRFSKGRLRSWPEPGQEALLPMQAQELSVLLYNGAPAGAHFPEPWRPVGAALAEAARASPTS